MNSFRLVSFATLLCCLGLTLPATGQEYNDPASRHEVPSDSTTAPGLNLNIPPESISPAQSNQLNSREFQPEITDEGSITDEYPCPIEVRGDFGSEFGSQPMLDRPLDFTEGTTDPISQLPPLFVHDRRTVRISDRIAEIWVKLPNDSQCSVSVNFVEYPPEGNFRIFRTTLTTKEPRRFYLSARRWDVKANHWVDLVAAPSLLNDGIPNLDYVDLRPGATEVIQFDNPQPPVVTKAFRFKPEQQEIVGTATLNYGHVPSVIWKKHPAILNISMTATALRLSALPDRAFTARINFTVHDSADRVVATLKPILVTFKNGKDTVEGEINFNAMVDGPLQNALVSHAASPGTYHLKASMSLAKDMGDVLGYQTITGDLGNDIELNINP